MPVTSASGGAAASVAGDWSPSPRVSVASSCTLIFLAGKAVQEAFWASQACAAAAQRYRGVAWLAGCLTAGLLEHTLKPAGGSSNALSPMDRGDTSRS